MTTNRYTLKLGFAESIAACMLLSLGSAHVSAQDHAGQDHAGQELAEAPQPGASTEAAVNIDTSTSFDSDAAATGPRAESGKLLVGGKIGGLASFNGLGPFVQGAVELGYVFPLLNHGLGAYLQVEYSAPNTKGHVNESFDPKRVPSGSYDWHITQQELVFAPTALYRMTFLSDWITPYVGIGPRVYLLKNTTTGAANGVTIDKTIEQSTKWGLGLPIGAEFALGPGSITAELMFQWGPLKHTLTGKTHLGGASLFVGYRLFLL